MTAEGVASLRASRAAAAARGRGGTGGTGGTGVRGKTLYFYNPKTKTYTYRVGGGAPGGGWILLGEKQPEGWVGGQTLGVATDVSKKQAELTVSTSSFLTPKEIQSRLP